MAHQEARPRLRKMPAMPLSTKKIIVKTPSRIAKPPVSSDLLARGNNAEKESAPSPAELLFYLGRNVKGA
jgi:hypothetical protein